MKHNPSLFFFLILSFLVFLSHSYICCPATSISWLFLSWAFCCSWRSFPEVQLPAFQSHLAVTPYLHSFPAPFCIQLFLSLLRSLAILCYGGYLLVTTPFVCMHVSSIIKLLPVYVNSKAEFTHTKYWSFNRPSIHFETGWGNGGAGT